ncbi:MAG: hypothetical protein Kow0089_15530 [Desulfobulbaceae bacterium]
MLNQGGTFRATQAYDHLAGHDVVTKVELGGLIPAFTSFTHFNTHEKPSGFVDNDYQ